jgi:two-component system sensor histidine kinase ChvG
MLRPSAPGAGGKFYYLAASPLVASEDLDTELDRLDSHGILDRLTGSCSDDTPIDIQYRRQGGKDDILTSLIPIQTRWGCWALVSSHTTAEYLYTSIARPFWATPDVRIASLIYLLGALIAVLVVTGVSRSLRHFRYVATEIRQGRQSQFTFATRDVPLELASAAADFDALALDLRKIAHDIRQTAEDNAHSFKAPVATIEASLETARRGLQPDDDRAARAITLIAASIGRLKALISAAQCLDNVTASLIEAPRERIDVTGVINTVLHRAQDLLTEREIRVISNLHEKAYVTASEDILMETIENVFDNAISFSPRLSVVAVTLIKSRDVIDLRIDDQGPGIDVSKIGRIFDRYFSLRVGIDDELDKPVPHAGLGLWIARRNLEALGGGITATNLPGAGLSVRMILPASRA